MRIVSAIHSGNNVLLAANAWNVFSTREIPFHAISRLIFFRGLSEPEIESAIINIAQRFHIVASALASEKSSHLGANPDEKKFVNSVLARARFSTHDESKKTRSERTDDDTREICDRLFL